MNPLVLILNHTSGILINGNMVLVLMEVMVLVWNVSSAGYLIGIIFERFACILGI